jgi:hypothetical protein
MGYESTLYVVDKSNYFDTNYPRFCFQIVNYDLGRFPPIAELFGEDNPESKFTDCGLYLTGDGDKQVTEDCYGDKLREASIETVIKVLRNPEEQYKDHQRLPPILAMLESFYTTWPVITKLAVIHFGH